MADSGYGVQVVEVTENHTYELNERELEKLLLNDEIKDLPVVVVSVAGAYRSGKSFLLNFFLRYLNSSNSARSDRSWLGDESAPLQGFKWRSGIKRTTTGILLWSKPFLMTLPDGKKAAVLLMDTQGTFDNTSTVRDCSTIFALSTLLSSVQIYNLSSNIQEDDLQHLQLFTEYGKIVQDQGSKAFQVLEFLVRDWPYAEDYPYGEVGGEQFIKDKLQILPNLPKEMQELRQHIRSSFEKTKCFLMPHPGTKVTKKTFTGKIADIDIDFRIYLDHLAKSLFSPEKLVAKTLNGHQIKARDMYNYFKTYLPIFNSGALPNPTSILQATVEVGLLSAKNEAREIYDKAMDADCGPKEPSVPAVDLKVLHDKNLSKAKTYFTNKKKMGTKIEADRYLFALEKELEQQLSQYVQSNIGKIQTAINKAKETYEDAIQNISKDKPLCVHASDLMKFHDNSVEAAMKIFDAARKRITNEKDQERSKFKESFEKRYLLLRVINEQNNMVAVKELLMEYWQYMQSKSSVDPPLSVKEFKNEHEAARKNAVENFDSKRNTKSNYVEDKFKMDLIKGINDYFIQLININKSKNKSAIEHAVNEYDNYMKDVLDKDKCLLPSHLERENDIGMCRALNALRSNKECSVGFDADDEDETTLQQILKQRYEVTKNINDTANQAAMQEAYSVYVSTVDDLCRPNLWWLLIIPIFIDISNRDNYHKRAKDTARDVFYGKRRNGEKSISDKYADNLELMMDKYYKDNY